MIRATAIAARPDDIEVELKISMTVGEWRRLRNQISEASYPSCAVSPILRELIEKFEEHFDKIQEFKPG